MRINSGRIMNNFIEPNKRQFSIPVYQRNYEWSKDQCVKLFNDIIVASKRNEPHFCGSVVYSMVQYKDGINYFIIIDGQQRMTTVYLMLKALMDMAPNEIDKERIKNVLMNNDPFQPYTIDDSSKLKLKPIKSDNNQLMLLIEGKYDEIDRGSGIWHNYEIFCDLIKKELDKGVQISQIYRGIQQLTCVDIILDDNDNAQEIFERINSTGVPLSLADKIRNFVLMTNIDQEALYENYWLQIEKLVKKDAMSSFFLDYLNMKIDGFTRESEAYDAFKTHYERGGYTNETILKELHHYAEFYHAFLYGDDSRYGTAINAILRDIQRLKQSTVFLFLFRVFDDFHNGVGNLDENELAKVLKLLLNYSIRRLVCEIGSNSLRGLYKTLYSRIFANESNKQTYYDSIVSFLLQLTSKDALPSDENFALALKEKNLYRKNALCKYLLVELENQGKEKIIVDNLSIEHIMPQNSNISEDWQKMLGSNWMTVKEKYLHTLGNLTLTGYNSELGDKPFDKKKQMLDDADSKVVWLNKDVMSCEEWNESTIVSRANRLASAICSIYAIEAPQKYISFMEPLGYSEHTCEDPEQAKGTKPNYFILQGERVLCAYYADMVRFVIDRLYEIDKRIITNMCENKEKLFRNSSGAFFSFNPAELSFPDQVADSNIYHENGYSAPMCIWIIKALLDKYEIDQSEFTYSAKQNK